MVGDHVPDHQRARDQADRAPSANSRNSEVVGRERSDPERVEEVGHEADAQLRWPGRRRRVRWPARTPFRIWSDAVPQVRRTPRTAHRIRQGPPATGRAGRSSGAILTTEPMDPSPPAPVFVDKAGEPPASQLVVALENRAGGFQTRPSRLFLGRASLTLQTRHCRSRRRWPWCMASTWTE